MKKFILHSMTFFGAALSLGCASHLERPYFYKATAPNGVQSYLLGTMHGGVSIDELPPQVMHALNQPGPLWVELDMSNFKTDGPFESAVEYWAGEDFENSPNYSNAKQVLNSNRPVAEGQKKLSQQLFDLVKRMKRNKGKVLPAAQFKNGESLKDRLPSNFWAEIVKIVKPPLQINDQGVEKLHIETVVALVGNAIKQGTVEVSAGKARRLQNRWSMDLNLAKWSKEKNKALFELDRIDTMPPSALAEIYLLSIQSTLGKSAEQILDGFDQIDQIYRTGDEAQIQKYITEQLGPQGYQAIIVERNALWLPEIKKQIEKAKANLEHPFFAFGAGHLFGPQGVIQLLKNEGYSVVRVEK